MGHEIWLRFERINTNYSKGRQFGEIMINCRVKMDTKWMKSYGMIYLCRRVNSRTETEIKKLTLVWNITRINKLLYCNQINTTTTSTMPTEKRLYIGCLPPVSVQSAGSFQGAVCCLLADSSVDGQLGWKPVTFSAGHWPGIWLVRGCALLANRRRVTHSGRLR